MERAGLRRLGRWAAHRPLGSVLVLALIATARVDAQNPAGPDWNARLELADSRGALEQLLEDMERDREGRTRSDTDFASTYVEATLRVLETVCRTEAAMEECERWHQRARAAASDFGTAHEAAVADYLWALELTTDGRLDEADLLIQPRLFDPEVPAATVLWALPLWPGIARVRGDYDGALQRLARANELIDSLSVDAATRSVARCETWLERAKLQLDMGLVDRARASIEHARLEPAASFDSDLAVRCVLILCQWTFAVEGQAEALALLDERFMESARLEEPAYHAQALLLLGASRAEEALDRGVPDAAAAQILESALAIQGIESDIARLARLQWVELALRSGDLAQARAQLVSIDSSGSVYERTRIHSYEVEIALRAGEDRTGLSARAAVLGEDLSEYMEQVRATPARDGGLGFLCWGNQRMAFSAWARAQLAVDPGPTGIERALGPLIEAHALGTLARALDATAGLEDVQRELVGPGRGVLVYLPATHRSHVFVIGPEGLFHAELPRAHVLWRVSSELGKTWRAPAPSAPDERRSRLLDIQAAGRAAAEAFLPPSVRAITSGWSQMLVVGADLCGAPSFECFCADGEGFLGLRQAVVYSSSLALSVRLARRPVGTGPLQAALFVAPDRDESAADAATPPEGLLSRDDAARLVSAFERERVRSWTGRAASLASLSDEAVASARLVAILAHGEYDAERCGDADRPALLRLARSAAHSGATCCADVARLRFPALVELLACGAARGPLRLGDSTAAHLVGASMIAGASTVLAATTDVSLAATVELACEFHRRLRDGETPAVALLHARQRVAASDERSDPWHWAGLALYGDASRPLFAHEPSPADRGRSWKWLAPAALLVAAGALAWVRIRRARRAAGQFDEG